MWGNIHIQIYIYKQVLLRDQHCLQGLCAKQQVKDVPSLPLSNQFAVLSITPQNEGTAHVNKSVIETVSRQERSSKDPLRSPSARIKHWEHRLLKTYIVAANPSPNSLNLKVGIQTTDMAEVKGVTALLDSGASRQPHHSKHPA